jgi:hypothetical protein
MICRGLKNNKMTVEQAEEKYQEFLELDLLDEDHQEIVEELISEALDELAYWDLAKKDIYRKDFEDDLDENEFIHEEVNEDALKYDDEDLE